MAEETHGQVPRGFWGQPVTILILASAIARNPSSEWLPESFFSVRAAGTKLDALPRRQRFCPAMMNEAPTLYGRLGGHPGILNLLKPFYADVRQHAVIGPIFAAHITDWNAHLAKITEFWALQTGGSSAYRGGFAGAHLALGLRPDHFQHWLGLWELNSARQLPPREAAEMITLAHEFGRRLLNVTHQASAFSLRTTTFPNPSPSGG